ncbi:MAG: ATPase, partial [Methanosarcina mazei]|nr:ATPase [Methanosarcina mazei]
MDVERAIKDIVSIDIFRDTKLKENFAGRPFYIDYEMLHMLVADSWKMKVGGLQHGSFLLAFYENEESVHEALLLRVLKPVKLPTDVEVISSMVEYYKDNLKTSGKDSKLDDFTRYEFSFSGLECRILGTFYKDQINKMCFGADVENFYSANNYSVY